MVEFTLYEGDMYSKINNMKDLKTKFKHKSNSESINRNESESESVLTDLETGFCSGVNHLEGLDVGVGVGVDVIDDGYYDPNWKDCSIDSSADGGVNFEIVKQKDSKSVELKPGMYDYLVVNGVFCNTLNDISQDLNNNKLNYVLGYKMLTMFLDGLRNINEKGFINDTNLINYPIINELIFSELIDLDSEKIRERFYDEENKGKNVLLGKKFIPIKDAELVYKWSFNLAVLKLYKLNEEIIFKLSQEDDLSRDNDLLIDYKSLSKELYAKLDLSIRCKLMKKGMAINQNIYTGFDTEYHHEQGIFNKLLSVQGSVCYQTSIQLPLNEAFDFKEINVSTGKSLNKKCDSKFISWYSIKLYIQNSITSIRQLKYGRFDIMISLLINELLVYKRDKGIHLITVNTENAITFIFERSVIRQFYHECEKYKFVDIVKDSKKLTDLEGDCFRINTLLNHLCKNINENFKEKFENFVRNENEKEKEVLNMDTNPFKMDMNAAMKSLNERIDKFSVDVQNSLISDDKDLIIMPRKNKRYTRTNNTSYTSVVLSVTKKINNYIIAHYTPADLSMLEDFEEYKDQFDIVNKSFVTLKKPILIDGVNVILRDSKLIAPAGKKSLDALSSLYQKIPKLKLPNNDFENMNLLLKNDPSFFKQYALQDSLISLVHGVYMQEFNNLLGGLGIPVTLSSLAGSFVRNFWKRTRYLGYQLSHKYLMTNVGKSLTPKGLSVLKEIGIKSTMYIANYRGGRNESFMYGFEKDTYWFDVDLISAYTTAMKLIGTPVYDKGELIKDTDTFKNMSWKRMINSYTILSVDFEFPDSIKYPSIPCDVEEGVNCYPLKGSAIITSLDYLVALKQGADITIKEGYTIPFKTFTVDDKDVVEKVFSGCIAEIQSMRSQHPKGTISNALWKEIGNSIYGLVVRGINEKLKFDARSGEMKRMDGNELSNPLIAGWITSFVRGVIGELLHGVQLLGGKVVSVTTDGFICDIDDFEKKFSELKSFSKSLYWEYRNAKESKDEILEIKNKGLGIMSWSTRGQLGVDSKIVATTGFQRSNYTLEEVYELFLNKLKGNKEINFIQTQLRSGKDIFKKGGNVTNVLSERTFRLLYDNKRFIIEDNQKTLLDSRPLNTIHEGSLLRYISKLPKTTFYAKNMSSSKSLVYKSKIDVAVRNFIKALFKNELNLNCNAFNCYSDIITYLKDFDKGISITENSISQLKRRGDFIKVPKTKETILFAEYIKIKFTLFNDTEFFK